MGDVLEGFLEYIEDVIGENSLRYTTIDGKRNLSGGGVYVLLGFPITVYRRRIELSAYVFLICRIMFLDYRHAQLSIYLSPYVYVWI